MMKKYDHTLFQYCVKQVVFSEDLQSVLLCKRKGEADHDDTYSFIGGKLEINDNSIIDGLAREKNEEIGSACTVKICPTYSYNVLFTKHDGHKMVIAHVPAIFLSGTIRLNTEEYSDFKWVQLQSLASFGPKIDNIEDLSVEMLRLLRILEGKDFVEI